MLRASAPSAIVNVASTAARVARPGTGAYSASKFALAGWSDALVGSRSVHTACTSGLVLPGFISTEGFPQRELTERALTRWIVSTPERAAEAIHQAGIGRRPERYVPRAYCARRRAAHPRPRAHPARDRGRRGRVMTTTTGAEADVRRNGSGPPAEERAHTG